jgi:hypothetical protein
MGVMERFESMTIENLSSGIGVWSDFIAKDITFRGCEYSGLNVWWADIGTIVDCEFMSISETALRLMDSDNVTIEDSVFDGVYTYIASGSNNCQIRRCSFGYRIGHDVALTFYMADGSIEDSDFSGGLYLRSAPMELTGNRFVVPIGDFCIHDLTEGGQRVLNDNLIEGGSVATIAIEGSNVEYLGSGNHIFRQPGAYAVSLHNSGSTTSIDLRGNYWGTSDEDSIAAWIYDEHDDPSEQAEVLYLPIEPGPVAVEKKSLGGLKALFR